MLGNTQYQGFMASDGFVQEFNIVYSEQVLDQVVSTVITALGWDGLTVPHVRITVTETGALGSSSTSTAALIVDTLPPGSRVVIINNGVISGKGGNGGAGGMLEEAPVAGSPGGPAIFIDPATSAVVELQNYGKLSGGGGGGGGGGRNSVSPTAADWGSSGGGGAGIPNGAGGVQLLPRNSWVFAASAESWTGTNATLSATGGILTVTATATDPQLISPSVSYVGATHRYIRVRARPLNSSPTWDGTVYYSTAGHGFSGSYYKSIAATPTQNVWATYTWDMGALSVGGSDYLSNTITQYRIDLASSQQNWEVAYVAMGSDSTELDLFEERAGYESAWKYQGNPGRFPYGGCHGSNNSSGKIGGRGGHAGNAGSAGATGTLEAGAAGGTYGAAITDAGSKMTTVNLGTIWSPSVVPSIATWSSGPMTCYVDNSTYTPPAEGPAISGIHEDSWVECANRNGSRFWKQVKNLVGGDLVWTISVDQRYANKFFLKDYPGTLPGSEEYNLYGHELSLPNASVTIAGGLCEVSSVPLVVPTNTQMALTILFSNNTTVKLLSAKMLCPNVYPSSPNIADAIWKRTEDFPDYRTRYYNRIVQTYPLDPISSSGGSILSSTLGVPESGKYRKVLLRPLTIPAGNASIRAGDVLSVGGMNTPPGNAMAWVH